MNMEEIKIIWEKETEYRTEVKDGIFYHFSETIIFGDKFITKTAGEDNKESHVKTHKKGVDLIKNRDYDCLKDKSFGYKRHFEILSQSVFTKRLNWYQCVKDISEGKDLPIIETLTYIGYEDLFLILDSMCKYLETEKLKKDESES